MPLSDEQRITSSTTTGQRQTLSASELCKDAHNNVVCREHIFGFTHNPEQIGYRTVMIRLADELQPQQPEHNSREDDAQVVRRLSADEQQSLLEWLDAP